MTFSHSWSELCARTYGYIIQTWPLHEYVLYVHHLCTPLHHIYDCTVYQVHAGI